jgi:hypothetical protein
LKSTKNSGAFSALIALVLLLRAIGPVVFAGSGGSDQLQKYDNFANACDFSIVDMSSCHPQCGDYNQKLSDSILPLRIIHGATCDA